MKTYKDHVTDFWKWFPQVADQFHATIEKGKCAELADEISQVTNTYLPGLSWVFGPGENGGHSFTASGEGIVPRQMLAAYWHSRSPNIPGWTFYASRQPSSVEQLKDIEIQVGELEKVDAENFLIQATVDDEQQVVDIVAWHQALGVVPEDHHLQILFLLLDEALGEFGTETWLGEVKVEPIGKDAQTRKLTELPEFLEQVETYHKWEKLPPLQNYSVYEVNQATDAPRGDTVVGTTCVPGVIFEFLENDGRLVENPIGNTGAEFAYIAIDGQIFPDGQQSDVRGRIEDALNYRLEKELSGRVVGGAFGMRESYIDLLLFDGQNSRDVINKTLHSLELDNVSRIESF